MVDWSHFGRPCVGETLSGDTAVVRETDDVVFVALIDVLGHGPEAYETARQAQAYRARSADARCASARQKVSWDIP